LCIFTIISGQKFRSSCLSLHLVDHIWPSWYFWWRYKCLCVSFVYLFSESNFVLFLLLYFFLIILRQKELILFPEDNWTIFFVGIWTHRSLCCLKLALISLLFLRVLITIMIALAFIGNASRIIVASIILRRKDIPVELLITAFRSLWLIFLRWRFFIFCGLNSAKKVFVCFGNKLLSTNRDLVLTLLFHLILILHVWWIFPFEVILLTPFILYLLGHRLLSFFMLNVLFNLWRRFFSLSRWIYS